MSNEHRPGDLEKNEAYREGYGEGRNGNFLGDFAQSIAKGMPGPDGPHQDLFDKGYEQGSQDRSKFGRLDD